MAEYHRGAMDIQEQKATFAAFNAASKWGSLTIATLVTMAVFWFCTPLGFITGVIAGVVVAGVGTALLRDKAGAH